MERIDSLVEANFEYGGERAAVRVRSFVRSFVAMWAPYFISTICIQNEGGEGDDDDNATRIKKVWLSSAPHVRKSNPGERKMWIYL